MISDSERRKVAARMREIMRKNPHMWFDVMVANAIRDVIGEGVVIGETVADLIDRPTWPRLLPQLRLRRLVPCPGRKCPLPPQLRRGGNR